MPVRACKNKRFLSNQRDRTISCHERSSFLEHNETFSFRVTCDGRGRGADKEKIEKRRKGRFYFKLSSDSARVRGSKETGFHLSTRVADSASTATASRSYRAYKCHGMCFAPRAALEPRCVPPGLASRRCWIVAKYLRESRVLVRQSASRRSW